VTIDRETLIAYVDGELPIEAERRFETALSSDTDLQKRVEEQRQLSAALRAGFDPVLTEDIPANILSAIETAPVSRPWRTREAFRWMRIFGKTEPSQFQIRMAVGTAVAVLALAAVIARETGGDTLIGNRNGMLVAQGSLASALETRLANDSGGGPGVGLSFRSKEGAICRTFAISERAGIACRSNDAWRIAALVAAGAESKTDFHAAGSTMPQPLRAVVTRMIKGDAFDAAQERAARQRGWK
jgi:hypothetical protein